MTHPIRVRRMSPHDWQTHRLLRLAALKDAPTAFGSSWEREAAMTDQDWQARAARLDPARFITLFAESGTDEPAGLATCHLTDEDPTVAALVSMWVAPELRNRRVGRELMEAAIAWARGVGCRAVRLSVTVGNTPAERLYAGLGFVPTGVTEVHRRFPELSLAEMELTLVKPGGGA